MGADVEFRLLGPLEVLSDGEPVRLPEGKVRTVLAALLLSPRRVVSAERLAHWLEDDTDRPGWSSRLHTYVNRLRQALSSVPCGRELIRTDAGGYLIDVDPSTIDRFRFRDLVRGAEGAEPAEAARGLAAALALWNGPALLGVESATLHREAGTPLTEEYLTAVERRIILELELGRHGAVVGELRALVRQHPLREELWRLLMLALLRSGRQGEALAAYRSIRDLLADELGIDPNPALREAHQLALSGTRQSTVDGQGQGQGHAATHPWVAACSLPPAAADFVGRERARAEITSWLGRAEDGGPKVVVIYGLPGVGKTALAARLARDLRAAYPDGQHWVRMQGETDLARQSHGVMGDILYATGVPMSVIPAPQRAREGIYRHRLDGRRVLVVLDDAQDPAQIEALLPGSAGCAFIVTAKRALTSLSGRVHQVLLTELTRDEGVALLERMLDAERAAGEKQAVREVVEWCDGHPLALRVIGSRLATMPRRRVASILPRLRDATQRLDQLATSDRQVRTGFAVGYASMPEDLRRTLPGLSLFGDRPFAAWAAGLLAGEEDGERVVERLLHHGMLAPAEADETGEPRYHLHGLLALYAEELLTEPREALRLLLDGYLVVSERANAGMVFMVAEIATSTPEQRALPIAEDEIERVTADSAAWFRSERDNVLDLVRRAIRAGFVREAGTLLDRICSTEEADGNWRRLSDLFAALRDASPEPGFAARAELGRINTGMIGSDVVTCAVEYEACLPRLAGPWLQAMCRRNLALCYHEQGRIEEALAAAEEAARLAEESGDGRLLAFCLEMLALTRSASGDRDQVIGLLDRALLVSGESAFNEVSRIFGEIQLRYFISHCSLTAGDRVRARRELVRALELLERTGRPSTEASVCSLLAKVNLADARTAEAALWAERAIRLFVLVGNDRGLAQARLSLATALFAQGERERVARELELALPVMRDMRLNITEQAEELLERVRSTG
ncbi:NB-ARC domain-containing protein [Allokutzneria sp. A3M-2-11 16]|uniref:AfsR/SARP family transcriptional regulator n=1 Tax=Allokutzneria sp. A3M-2-11 16 TaxID=2962043 RepID=UPI0020B6626A|nr:BTAD domain-containing putative transcriptional regulator [Allokutzneria sp. A3M-2-11 16]MCP3805537.1 NB-ARC domain-containing protein [Allokutzneria sp. A3M-2-11 16]